MSTHRDLLIEIGCEELPPKALPTLSAALQNALALGLNKAGLATGRLVAYATPRRLAVLIHDVLVQQPDRTQVRRGPALTAAFDSSGLPTPAALGFAKSCGVAVDGLEKEETDKGAWLIYPQKIAGGRSAELIPDIVRQALTALPIPKRMRWGARRDEFVRPVHWVVLLFGDEVLDAEILGVRTGRCTYGHRFHHPQALYLGSPTAYAPLLATEGYVMADFATRREAIRAQVLEAAAQCQGTAVIDPDLLDEVTALVEWPQAIIGEFDANYLSVPAAALISTMQGNQRYFHLVDRQQALLPYFITIANIASREPEKIKAGNERVIRPRLADAMFFWEQDRQHPLHTRLEMLKSVVYQDKLGTLYDKTLRIVDLAGHVARQMGQDPTPAQRAALLCKCDLMTRMVGEFPELQGIMGRYYAQHDREIAIVAQALDDYYKPRYAGDDLPATYVAQAVALADRLDTLTAIFSIGLIPSGDKDPFALRRAALSVLRILIEQRLDINLLAMLAHAAGAWQSAAPTAPQLANAVFDFMLERLRAYYSDAGIKPDVFEAVLAVRPSHPLDFDRRIHAVTAFRTLPEAESLAAANKRIRNILRQVDTVPTEYHIAALTMPQERDLATQLNTVAPLVEALLQQHDYAGALQHLAKLRPAVDAFFENVMVLVEDRALRDLRLGLLNSLSAWFLRIADISRLQQPG